MATFITMGLCACGDDGGEDDKGSSKYAALAKVSLLNCEFNGKVVFSGSGVVAFLNGSGNCEAEFRQCQDGELNGHFQFAACSESIH